MNELRLKYVCRGMKDVPFSELRRYQRNDFGLAELKKKGKMKGVLFPSRAEIR